MNYVSIIINFYTFFIVREKKTSFFSIFCHVQISRIFQSTFILSCYTSNVAQTKIAICNVVFRFTPHHWYTKRQRLSFAINPLPHIFGTRKTHLMRSPLFIQITKRHAKVSFICIFIKLCYISSLFLWSITPTCIAKGIRTIYAPTSIRHFSRTRPN